MNGHIPAIPGQRRSALPLACMAALLAACSTLQLTYNNADVYLRWRGGQYFDFEAAAAAEFERRVDRFLSWHRRTALPQYARLAEEAAGRLADGLSQADLVWGYDAFQAQVREGLRAAAGEVADLLDALAPAQIEILEKRLAKQNREFAKDNVLEGTPEERRKKRLERNIERLDDWLGSVNEAQYERVRLYSVRAPLEDKMRDRDRKRLQREFVALLRARQAKETLAEWAVNWERNRDPAYDVARREHLQEYFRMLLDLDKTLSSAQRTHAVRRLQGFARDFAALAAGAGAN